MNIFITGASGFIGSNIVKRLSAHNTFYAMCRTEFAAEKVRLIGAIPVYCELGHVEAKHLNNCDMIIHAAAFTKEWGTREEFWQTTVDGTKQLIEIAKKSKIKRFLHISTEAVLFVGNDLNYIDESYPLPKKSKFLYSESKLESEKLVLNSNLDGVFEVMVIRPRLVWGPGDQTILPILVNMVKLNKFTWINDGSNKTSTTHIYNLIEGIKCALENWRSNQIYFITDKEISTYKDFLSRYIATKKAFPSDKNISKFVVRTLANVVEFFWQIFKIKNTPPITRLAAYMLSSNFTINHQKAIIDLGYKPVITLDEAFRELNHD
ncbi:NAD-dependent epimerase/dehydratase family protein [Lacihabitans soyangensis]|uniref:NAD(P)-dependent oxidoreductase n=1 Tax=Lacihabitans soyangensis TaxID=869394 RepID=A0AAE3H5Q6_9BACT|nr:NAD(P)-dependent oxidoreductase [Lacihabitans soyangensis]MCP9765679.1 NAD(P)-dependent oxidoreductase [Lacihabitans soyangensis]